MAEQDNIPTVTSTPSFEELQQLGYLGVMTRAGDAILESIAQTQEQFLDTFQKVAEALPKAPELATPSVLTAEANVPTPRELIDVGFHFADRLLERQKAFAARYLELTSA